MNWDKLYTPQIYNQFIDSILSKIYRINPKAYPVRSIIHYKDVEISRTVARKAIKKAVLSTAFLLYRYAKQSYAFAKASAPPAISRISLVIAA